MDLERVDTTPPMRGGQNDLGVDTDSCCLLVPVFDDGLRAIYDCAIKIKQ